MSERDDIIGLAFFAALFGLATALIAQKLLA